MYRLKTNNFMYSKRIVLLGLIFSLAFSIFFYIFFVNHQWNQITEYQRANCKVIKVSSSYHRCCHLLRFLPYDNRTDFKVYPPCLRQHVAVERNQYIPALQYCLDNEDEITVIREMNCGKCSQHSVQLSSLEPSPHFFKNDSHLCDFRKPRCIDKIWEKFNVNNTVPCWEDEVHSIFDTPLVGHIVVSVFVFFVSVVVVLILSIVVVRNFQQSQREALQAAEDENYDWTFLTPRKTTKKIYQIPNEYGSLDEDHF